MNSPLKINGRGVHSTNFDWDEKRKLQTIQEHFAAILETLGLDLNDDSLRDTPRRVAKMYVHETFAGLDPKNRPRLSLFENTCGYDQMLLEKNISFHSICEHHFLPVIGKAHVAYIPAQKIIGLSKINRLVHYYASRPQLQERLTMQILDDMCSILDIEDAAVWIEAIHLCVTARGIKDQLSSTITAKYSGKFLQEKQRNEFLNCIRQPVEQIL